MTSSQIVLRLSLLAWTGLLVVVQAWSGVSSTKGRSFLGAVSSTRTTTHPRSTTGAGQLRSPTRLMTLFLSSQSTSTPPEKEELPTYLSRDSPGPFAAVPSRSFSYATTSSSFPSPPSFLMQAFSASSASSSSTSSSSGYSLQTECDDSNRPPSLNIVLRSLHQLTHHTSSSDIRGRFVSHPRWGSMATVAHEMGQIPAGGPPALTPLAAYCFGRGLAHMLLQEQEQQQASMLSSSSDNLTEEREQKITIIVGQDPRPHGKALADGFCRGAESVDPRIQVFYTGVATTPACAAFCRDQNLAQILAATATNHAPLGGCQAAVMVTASHLPVDRNGFKLFTQSRGGFSAAQVQEIGRRAMDCADEWFHRGILPPQSGQDAVMCAQWVDWMPAYAQSLKQAILREVGYPIARQNDPESSPPQPLAGLKIILNSGNGSGGFFYQVLKDLGADVSASLYLEPDGAFPNGIPNPEYRPMLERTVQACQAAQADLGIMLDTDADRCGFVTPRTVLPDGTRADYEALNRNRLIALLGVVFARSHPGATIVTDSVTSEGLTTFLQDTLGLKHYRYKKGYSNVINKARELDAEVAIETSGHCAMKENGYLDDGTYTAVKVVSLLARERARSGQANQSLLDLIAGMPEMPQVDELRMTVQDESLDTMAQTFDFCAVEVERMCQESTDPSAQGWQMDTDNVEGIRIRIGQGQFFMLRKSLHDPIISLQIEGQSKDHVRKHIVEPLLRLFEAEGSIASALDLRVLRDY